MRPACTRLPPIFTPGPLPPINFTPVSSIHPRRAGLAVSTHPASPVVGANEGSARYWCRSRRKSRPSGVPTAGESPALQARIEISNRAAVLWCLSARLGLAADNRVPMPGRRASSFQPWGSRYGAAVQGKEEAVAGAAAPAGMRVPFERLRHFAAPAAWVEWRDALRARGPRPSGWSRAWEMAGASSGNPAIHHWMTATRRVWDASRAAEAAATERLKRDEFQLFGRRGNASAELELIPLRVWSLLRRKPGKPWEGGGLQYWLLELLDLAGLPPDQAMLAYGSPELVKAWEGGAVASVEQLQDGLLTAIRAGWLVIDHQKGAGHRSNLTTDEAQLLEWASTSGELTVRDWSRPLVGPLVRSAPTRDRPDAKQSNAGKSLTSATEAKCIAWLVVQMRGPRRNKAQWFEAAAQQYPGLSRLGFSERIWPKATSGKPELREPGRIRLKDREIE